MHSLGARRARAEGVEAPLVEGADGVPDRLRGASEAAGYLGGRLTALAGQKDLAPTHHEGVLGAQSGFEPFALVFRQFPNKNWRFHGSHFSSSHTTLSEDALGNSVHKRKPGFIADSSSPAIRSQAQLLRLYTAMIGKEGKGKRHEPARRRADRYREIRPRT